MTQYLISFDEGAMAHIPANDLPDVAEAGHAVVQEAKDAGVFVPTWDAALEWAAKVAVACRCAQDVREFFPFRRSDLGS
ncbi:hypothetical protein OG394_34905 [Kribbella sp. NBC_01245]|uniref:hypothetical protein n=1 Tax=Kribbella sp. NBC_01245 TaxID=2903578 RepID=UPI002E2C0259|nr:hypothetical protein [Kribbella sp. NBC_01245]